MAPVMPYRAEYYRVVYALHNDVARVLLFVLYSSPFSTDGVEP